jgi:hypothetical protein
MAYQGAHAPVEPDQETTSGEDGDFEAILNAVMETARGRWFLAEYARRNRNADTRVLLDALARLETALAQKPQTLAAAPSRPYAGAAANMPSSRHGSAVEAELQSNDPMPGNWVLTDLVTEAPATQGPLADLSQPEPARPARNFFDLTFEEKVALFS